MEHALRMPMAMATRDGAGDDADDQLRATIAAARRGEPRAFAALVRQYQDRLLAYLATRAPAGVQAEDLAQAVFVAALESLPRFDPQRGDFGGWLFGIAANHLRRAWTGDARERRGLAGLTQTLRGAFARWAGDAREGHRARQRLDALERCLDQLPEHWRALVAQHYEHGRPLTEIAASRGNAPATIGVTMHRIRQRLRTCIEARLAQEDH